MPVSGIIGLPEGISQRAVIEHNQQDSQVHVREAGALELKKQQIRRQRRVGKPRRSDQSKIRDRSGGQGRRRKLSQGAPGQERDPVPDDQESAQSINITA
jgi:hypothetical protein